MSNLQSPNTKLLRTLAERLSNNPDYFAYTLRRFSKRSRFDAAQFAKMLETSEDNILRLALCLNPKPGSAEFRLNIEKISEYSNVQAPILANLIRQIDAIETFSQLTRKSSPSTQLRGSLFSAARDKEWGTGKEEIKNDDVEED